MANSPLPQPSSSIYTTDIVNGVNNNQFREASFSSYLRPNKENYALELADSFRKPSLGINLTDETILGKSKIGGQSEIRVFDAEKYLKMEIGDASPAFSDSSLSKFWAEKSENRVDLQSSRSKSRPGTPSTTYESSWSSDYSALVPTSIQTPSHKERKGNGNRFLAGFAFKGSCSDGKSVHINKNGLAQAKEFLKKSLHLDQNSTIGYKKEDKFTFPILKSGVNSIPTTVKTQTEEEKPEEGRDSIEVYGSHLLNRGDIAENLERKLSVLTWDAIPQTPKVRSNNSRTSEPCDHDVGNDSDSSSDLFEIENIGKVSTKPLFVRQQSDGNMSSCMTPTTLYAPSEASIEWSVITASAADFRAVSEYDELKMLGSNPVNKHKMLKSLPASGLLGCKSAKAVNVVVPAYKK